MDKEKKAVMWVHLSAKRAQAKRLHRRKADGQDFHERLTLGGIKKLLSQGGIALCGLEPASKEREVEA